MFSPKSRRLDFIPIALVSALSFVLHLIAIRGFGLFRDELYYIACSDHLAWGFVDQPPLSILVLKMVRLLFGDSPTAVRLLPALGGAAFVFLTGLLARALGGERGAPAPAARAGFASGRQLFCEYGMVLLTALPPRRYIRLRAGGRTCGREETTWPSGRKACWHGHLWGLLP